MDVVAGEIARLDDGMQLGERAVRAGEVGRAADQPGNHRHELLQNLLRGLAGGELCRVTAEVGFERVYRASDLGANVAVDRIGQVLARSGVEKLHRTLPTLIGSGVTRPCRAP